MQLLDIKVMLSHNQCGKYIIKIWHYCIAVPLFWISNLRYRIKKHNIKKLKFVTYEETFELLTTNRKSLCRFGDGEISWIYMDSKKHFGQDNTEELSRRLKEVLLSSEDNILIAVPDFFDDTKTFERKNVNARNVHLLKYEDRWMELLSDNKTYADSMITRIYNGRKQINSKKLFDCWKNVWNSKNVVIVEGDKTRFGVGNDLLENALSVKRILAPSENAFKSYKIIMQSVISNIDKDDLILIALGPTATVMAYDLALSGYQCIDIGHLDIEYEWFRKKTSNKVPIKGKYVNEAGGVYTQEMDKDVLDDYTNEILLRIK